jgi:hypothetical protein
MDLITEDEPYFGATFERQSLNNVEASLKTSTVLLLKENGRDEVVKKTVYRDAL